MCGKVAQDHIHGQLQRELSPTRARDSLAACFFVCYASWVFPNSISRRNRRKGGAACSVYIATCTRLTDHAALSFFLLRAPPSCPRKLAHTLDMDSTLLPSPFPLPVQRKDPFLSLFENFQANSIQHIYFLDAKFASGAILGLVPFLIPQNVVLAIYGEKNTIESATALCDDGDSDNLRRLYTRPVFGEDDAVGQVL